MRLTVSDRARRIATFRFIEVKLMETAARWTPTTPEMEVKVLLGRHIWDFAQHADALGKRTFELRAPLQHSERPRDAYVELLDEVAALTGTAERLAALYDAVLPGLDARHERYLGDADPILDAPSVVILERIRADARRQRGEAERLRSELGLPAFPVGALRARESGVAELVAEGAGA
jgi:hypothetical protein